MTQTVPADAAVNLSPNSFSCEGKNFAGWAESPSGQVKYSDCSQIKISQDTSLYAIWNTKAVWESPNVSPKKFTYDGECKSFGIEGYDITYMLNGNEVVSPTNVGIYDVVISKGNSKGSCITES